MKAIWNDNVIAESEDTIVIEGNHYFPPAAIKKEYFKPTATHTVCPWKGTASYYQLIEGDTVEQDAAWYYPEPKEMAKQIANYVAFYPNKVSIEK